MKALIIGFVLGVLSVLMVAVFVEIKYWDDLPYRWVSSMRMDEPGVWRKAET